jgi:putative ABC transport system permease protein
MEGLMIKNYFKIAWRNLWKNKVFSIINVIGLAIGMTACLVIMLFVLYEKSFDKFHKKNIYRLNEVQKFEGMVASQKVALSMFPMGPTLKNEFPEIKTFTRIWWNTKYQATYREKRMYLPQIFFVDSTFLQVFDFKLIKGSQETVLQKPNSAVLTKATAEKLFGAEDPIGKTITHYAGDTTSFIVTGILENIPQNSQLQFDALYTISTFHEHYADMMKNWGGNWLNTYLELVPNTNVVALEGKFPAYLKEHMADGDGWKNYQLFLLPLRDVHAKANDIGLDYLNYQKFNYTYTNIFSIIAIIVLVIACVNFMNLSTARSAERAREVGIRKSVGAQRFQLGLQFIGETVLLSLVALLFAILLLQLVLPYVNNLSQRNLRLPFFNNPLLLVSVFLGTVAVGILSGIYPAIYLSSFQPVRVLKGSIQIGKNKGALRNVLVVAQFASAIFLIITTVFALRQLRYMQSRDPGFARDQVVTIPLDAVTFRKVDVMKQQLLSNTLISGVTAAQDVLGSHLDQSGVQFKGDGPVRQLTSTRLIVDHDYLSVYKIPLLMGRNFSSEPTANGKEYIINESLAKELLKDNPAKPMSWLLGKNFGFDSIGTIVGIARDFNFNSLHYKIETMFIFNQKDWGFSNMSVKINARKASTAIALIQSIWKKNCPDHPFDYQFLDDHFKEVYRADTQVSNIVGVLAALAIIISCLGLFGLASYSAEKRVKEVGIRKVLGASVENIVGLLSKHFVKLVLIANFIAWPAAWFVLKRWLQDYAYRVNMSWWVFIIAGITAMSIALITVSFQSIRAAIANPVKSLRTE